MATPNSKESTTSPVLGIIGCGSLGTAVLNGLLSPLSPNDKGHNIFPQHFIATVRSESSASKLRGSLSTRTNTRIFQGDNVRVAAESNIIILSCPPDTIPTVLAEAGMHNALRGKVLISLAAGVTRSTIERIIDNGPPDEGNAADKCWVMRAMPNIAATVGKSITGIEVGDPPPPEGTIKLVDSIFEQIGSIIHLPASQMDACTALCGSTPAFIALFCDSLIDGAVASGVPRGMAQFMTIQTLLGTATLLQNGQRPSTLREDVCAQPGCTIEGIMTLEQGGIRGIVSKAMRDTIMTASHLA
ncbi:putative pyrroline-5-carboxylate reductase [Tricladium varicosporioides]|nr:putative pyrroline-5-carboxylate reductase [Hymenoscyphus varicosporioides]